MSTALRLRATAPAKVNLWLEVRGKRPDGYHEIDTVMLALDWTDELSARPAREFSLRVSGPAASADVPLDARNLVWRAAGRVWRAAGASGGLALELVKHLPSQAGLGGGSADAAAAALLARDALLASDHRRSGTGPGGGLGTGGEPEALGALLAELGSDCAFFVLAPQGLARCRGRGELVEPLGVPALELFVVLVTPALTCATPAVYAALDLRSSHAAEEPPSGLFEPALEAVRGALANRLEGAALAAYPDLVRIRRWLDARGAEHFRLSGSGSTFFGVFASADAARGCAAELAAAARRDGVHLRAVHATAAGPGARRL